MARRTVVLPHPDGPSKVTKRPLPIGKENFFTALKEP